MKLIKKLGSVKGQINGAISSVSLARAYFSLVADPNNTLLVFKLQEQMLKAASATDRQNIIAQFKQDSTLGPMLEERYLAPDYAVEDLASKTPGTLGYAYYRHMHDNGFTPDFFPPVKPVDELSYFELRMRQTHDIWHVITGFNPSVEEEVGLQAFYAAQMSGPFNFVLVSAGVLHGAIRNPKIAKPIMEAIIKGWETGKAARPIAAAKWEEMWDRPLADIRREYNVIPISTLYDFSASAVTEERELVKA